MLLQQSPFRGDDEDEIYDAILADEPLYPIHMPRDSVSILQKLLTREPELRLGSGPTDAQEIMSHSFFRNINWDDVRDKKIPPPFQPQITSPTDTSNFDPEFTSVTPVLTPVQSGKPIDHFIRVLRLRKVLFCFYANQTFSLLYSSHTSNARRISRILLLGGFRMIQFDSNSIQFHYRDRVINTPWYSIVFLGRLVISSQGGGRLAGVVLLAIRDGGCGCGCGCGSGDDDAFAGRRRRKDQGGERRKGGRAGMAL